MRFSLFHRKPAYYSKWFLIISFFVSAFLAATVGLFELPDGFFYVAIGQYLLTGENIPIQPFNIDTPTTLFAPIYGFLSYIGATLPAPWGMTLLVFVQLYALFVSGFLTFKTAKLIWKNHWPTVTGMIFFLLPFSLIYATTLMSESVALFLFSLWIYILARCVTSNTFDKSPFLVLVAALMTLTRNVFVVLLIISCGLWIAALVKQKMKKTNHIVHIPAVLGLMAIGWWILFNHSLYGEYILASHSGMHLYNNVVHIGKLTPPETHPVWKEFTAIVPPERIYDPEWEVQTWFGPAYRAGAFTERSMDKLFMRFSVASIMANPLLYMKNVGTVAYGTITTPPYHRGMLTQLGFEDPECPTCNLQPCRILWNKNLCKPLVNSSLIHFYYGLFILASRALYPGVMLILFGLAVIGGIRAIVQKQQFIVMTFGVLLLFVFIQSAAQQSEGRYLIPLYPLIAILITNALVTASSLRTRNN